MAAVEATLILLIGVLLGTLVSSASLIPFSLSPRRAAAARRLGVAVRRVVGFAALLTYAGTLPPTWLQLRQRPLEAVIPS